MAKTSDPFAMSTDDTRALVFHQAGCPAARLETYTATRARRPHESARDVEVTRCIDCGAHYVDDSDA